MRFVRIAALLAALAATGGLLVSCAAPTTEIDLIVVSE